MERDQFKWLWLKVLGEFIEGARALKSQAIVAFFVSRCRPLLLSLGCLLLCLLIFQVVWQFFWVVPNQKLAAERVTPSWKRELTQKEAHELQNSIRQTFMQALGGAALLLGFYFHSTDSTHLPRNPPTIGSPPGHPRRTNYRAFYQSH